MNVNIRNVHNTIPLHLALAKGAKPCVELLLSVGANCNIQVGSLIYVFVTVIQVLSKLLSLLLQPCLRKDGKDSHSPCVSLKLVFNQIFG